MNGKGSKPRPLSVKYDTFAENWDSIKGFKKNKPPPDNKPTEQNAKPHEK